MAFALVLVSLLIAVTCAGGSRVAPSPAPVGSESAPSPVAPAPAPPLPEGGLAAPDAASDAARAVEPARSGLALPRFFAALSAAATGGARARVLWLGDSHSAADFLPHAVRQPLQRRFGNGGPGFVSIGIDKYRHGALSVKSEGKWRREPPNPSAGSRHADGIFGLAGVRAVPVSADARTRLELLAGAVAGGARWEILFRAPQGARFGVRLDSNAEQRIDASSGKPGPAGSSIRRLRIESPARATLAVLPGSGSPELFGAIVESRTPGGVVVDTLGINGGRVSTALAWDEAAFIAEARARAPALFVIAYGTNEAASSLAPQRYEQQLAELVARARRAAPNADCLLLGPPDMADREGFSLPRVPEFDRATESAARNGGCGFFSLYRAMGGEGSMARFVAETPPLAIKDHIHLTARGYEKLGAALATEILEAYDRSVGSGDARGAD